MKNFIFNLFVDLVLISGLSFAGCFDSSKSGGGDTASDIKSTTFTGDRAGVLFVDIDAVGNENGGSWEDAFTHPMDAIDVAGLDDEIWVAEGSYAPRDDEGTPEDNVLIMKIGVAIYGGFAGAETSIEERDIEGHETIFDGNGAAIHVVVGADNSHLDGFTITGGNATGDESDGKGGGMYNCETSPVVSNCLFTGNTAEYGGAIYNSENTVEIADSVFQGNTADDGTYYGYGGAIYNDENSSTEISGCDFNENTARGAGAVYNESNWAIIIDCEFNNNSADLGTGPSCGYGGAICNIKAYVITISRCNFIENRSNHSGGGINTSCMDYTYTLSTSLNISECTFINNETKWKGGAIRNHYYVQMNVENCLFIGNKASMNAGGVNISYSTLGNSDGWGKFTNCIFSGNNIQALCVEQGSSSESVILTNCVLWGNPGSEIWSIDPLVVTYSNIYMEEGIYPGEGNINADPRFVDPGYWDDNGTPEHEEDDFWVNGDYHIQAGSPCIDSALGDVLEEPEFYPPEFDLDGNSRYDDPFVENTGSGDPEYVDMGAYEYQGQGLYVLHLGLDEGGLDIFPMEVTGQDYYTGAASGLQALKFFDPDYTWPDQENLYNNYHDAGSQGEDMTESELASMLTDQTNSNPDTAPYNFMGLSDTDQEHAIKRMIYWMDYQISGVDEPNTPAHVPTNGAYSNNWQTVRGFMCNRDPWVNWQMPDNLELHGLWLNDPKAGGLGYNIYITGNEFNAIYQAIDGNWRYVVDPPMGVDLDKVDRMLEPISIKYMESRRISILADALDKQNILSLSSDSISKFDAEECLRRYNDVQWDQVIPEGLLNSKDFNRIFSESRHINTLKVKDLDNGEDYGLALFSQSGKGDTASIVLMIGSEQGKFRQASWEAEDHDYPPISEKEAIAIARKSLGGSIGIANVYRTRLVTGKEYCQSPFLPMYQVSTNGGIAYVLQDGSCIVEK